MQGNCAANTLVDAGAHVSGALLLAGTDCAFTVGRAMSAASPAVASKEIPLIFFIKDLSSIVSGGRMVSLKAVQNELLESVYSFSPK
jgi:hypothetical protein